MQTLLHRGCPLAYKVDGNGPPVVFIQGVGLHGDGWKPQVDGLSAKFQCLSFDNRGMGRSQPIGASVTVEQMAEDTLVLMDTLGWESAHVVGHSLGGLVAQHLGLTARDRVRSLSLLCTVARGADATRLSAWMLAVGLRTRIGPRRGRRMAFLKIVMPPEVLATADRDALAAELAPFFGHDLADQPPVAMKQLSALRAYDATNRLRELAGIPTLVVSARYDRIAPPDRGRALADGIPQARFVEFSDASHGVTIQLAGRINHLLDSHFSGHQVS